eukprot:6467283-Amphidinium_carterae.1
MGLVCPVRRPGHALQISRSGTELPSKSRSAICRFMSGMPNSFRACGDSPLHEPEGRSHAHIATHLKGGCFCCPWRLRVRGHRSA